MQMKTKVHKLAYTISKGDSQYHIHKNGMMMMGLDSFGKDEDSPLTPIDIHLLSKEEVKKGDCYVKDNHFTHSGCDLDWEGYYKVTASTRTGFDMPTIKFNDLTSFISSCGNDCFVRVIVDILDDNSVVIDKVKEDYSRMEMIDKLKELVRTADFLDFTREYGLGGWAELDEWIGKNV